MNALAVQQVLLVTSMHLLCVFLVMVVIIPQIVVLLFALFVQLALFLLLLHLEWFNVLHVMLALTQHLLVLLFVQPALQVQFNLLLKPVLA